MHFWSIVICGIAAVVAIQGLLSLMTAHRKTLLRRFLEEESQLQQPEPSVTDKTQIPKAA